MTDIVDRIWDVPAYLPGIQLPLSALTVADAEKQIGFELPKEYLALLERQNGGSIRYSLPDVPHDQIFGIGPTYPSLLDFDWEECQEYVSFPLNGLVPFDGDGHWYLCLDYRRNSKSPSVTYIDLECDSESPIASTFADYLSQLRRQHLDRFAIMEAIGIDEVQKRLAKLLKLSFSPPSSWEQGYPIHRAAIGKKSQHENIWISSNTVPRGFVRPEESCHEELMAMTEEHSRQFPELPGHCLIVSISASARPRVIEAFAAAALPLMRISELIDER